MNRHRFLHATTTAFFAPDAVERARAASTERRSPDVLARDEDFWRDIQQAFTVDRNIINFNNGGVSPSPKIVQDAMRRYLEISNLAPVYTMWRLLDPEVETVRTRLAGEFGCDREEMAIVRNASEALETCQLGLDLKPGDEVLTTDQDYPRMLTTWDQRARRDGLVIRKISIPTPPGSLSEITARFEQAITPKTKVIHFCHITNLTGQIYPVKDICRLARSRGIEAIVDGAHAFAQFPYKLADLDCDYYGTSLHKWLLAPHGTGFLYVRKSKIPKLWPLMAAPDSLTGDIRKFEQFGTHPAANFLAIGEALAFHQALGVERKAARLRYLRQVWTDRLTAQPKFSSRTSKDPSQSAGLGLLSIEGMDPGKLTEKLFDQHRILVTGIKHADFEGIRITPNIYSTMEEMDRFCAAVEKIVRAS
jgi:selenocysteine lyase/cysteine desulfurase